MAIRWVAILILALLPLAAAPLVGAWVAAISGLLLALVAGFLLLTSRPPHRVEHRWAMVLASGLASLGGLVGAANAAAAAVTLGGVAPYRERVGFGWLALGLAVAAGLGGHVATRRPVAGALLMVGAGLLGGVAINLLSIDTWYVLAVPLWLVAAIAALAIRAVRQPPERLTATDPPRR